MSTNQIQTQVPRQRDAEDLGREILRVIRNAAKATPQLIHQLLQGQHPIEDIEAKLIEMDLAGYVRNDLQPVTSITQKGKGYLTR